MARILLIDDDDFSLASLQAKLEPAGYECESRQDPLEALQALLSDPLRYDGAILDRVMPGLDGISFMRKIQESQAYKEGLVPFVVMHTGSDSQHEIAEGIQAGALHYITKPCDPQLLLATVARCAAETQKARETLRRIAQAGEADRLLFKASFKFQTLDEAALLASRLACFFPRPGVAAIGLAEMLINAVEHGNLEIDFQEKSRLLEQGRWTEAIAEKLASEPFKFRMAVATAEKTPDGAQVTIADQGPGFDTAAFANLSPALAQGSHGRGIALCKTLSFDSVEYNGCGNIVVCRQRA